MGDLVEKGKNMDGFKLALAQEKIERLEKEITCKVSSFLQVLEMIKIAIQEDDPDEAIRLIEAFTDK